MLASPMLASPMFASLQKLCGSLRYQKNEKKGGDGYARKEEKRRKGQP